VWLSYARLSTLEYSRVVCTHDTAAPAKSTACCPRACVIRVGGARRTLPSSARAGWWSWWRACLIIGACVGGAAADVIPGDRAALVDLYTATGGAGWTYKAGWNTAAGVCTWFGVTCSGDGSRVTELCVAMRGVECGPLHCALRRCAQVPVLESADGHHSRQHRVPHGVALPVSLRPRALRAPTSRRCRNLKSNQLTGTIPSSIGSLTALNFL
jgi:hypothetical protein